MSTDNCGHTIIDKDGYEQPCDLPAGEWRWYQDVEHEDMLAPACVIHANEGGRRMHVAEAAIARVEARLDEESPCLDRHLGAATCDHPGCVLERDIRGILAEPERDEEGGND